MVVSNSPEDSIQINDSYKFEVNYVGGRAFQAVPSKIFLIQIP